MSLATLPRTSRITRLDHYAWAATMAEVEKLPPYPARVLQFLAHRANIDGESWWTQVQIAEATQMCESSVRNALKLLGKLGLIERKHRYLAKFRRTSDVCRINAEKVTAWTRPVDGYAEEPSRIPVPGAGSHPVPGAGYEPEPEEPEPELQPPPTCKVTNRVVPDQGGGGERHSHESGGCGDGRTYDVQPAPRPAAPPAPTAPVSAPPVPVPVPVPEPQPARTRVPAAETPRPGVTPATTPPTREHWDAGFDVLASVADAWDRPLAALARFAPDTSAAIAAGWRPDALGRHLAHRPPAAGIDDAAGLLRYRLGELPASPDQCGRKCCASHRHDPPRPATCTTHQAEMRDGVCVYCEIAAEAAQRRAEHAAAERRQAEADTRRKLADLAERLGPKTMRAITGRTAGIESGYVRGKLISLLDEYDGDIDKILTAVAEGSVQPPSPAVTTARTGER